MRLPLLFIATLLAFSTRAQEVLHVPQRIDSLSLLPAADAYSAVDDIMQVLREKVSAEEGRGYVQQMERVVAEMESHTLMARFFLHKGIWTNVTLVNKAGLTRCPGSH